jgi:sugar-specific transcriptional regulator TrmB
VLGSINATFTRLQSAANLESEIKELPMRLMKLANQQQFRESLRITLQEEHKKMVEASHEIALNFITENISKQMCDAMIEAEQRVFGDSFVINHKFYLENEVLMGQIDVLKKRNIELEQRFYGCVADREKAVSELKNKQLRKLIPAMALSVILGAIANNAYLPAVVHDFFIQRSTES